jgi:hypothetical protein
MVAMCLVVAMRGMVSMCLVGTIDEVGRASMAAPRSTVTRVTH